MLLQAALILVVLIALRYLVKGALLGILWSAFHPELQAARRAASSQPLLPLTSPYIWRQWAQPGASEEADGVCRQVQSPCCSSYREGSCRGPCVCA